MEILGDATVTITLSSLTSFRLIVTATVSISGFDDVTVPAVLQLQKTEANANAKNILFIDVVLFLLLVCEFIELLQLEYFYKNRMVLFNLQLLLPPE